MAKLTNMVKKTFRLVIRKLDVTERAFSTYNDEARIWMQIDTDLLVEERAFSPITWEKIYFTG
jgi:hypothetical protein